jgi:fatty-acyl-CoA synthase
MSSSSLLGSALEAAKQSLWRARVIARGGLSAGAHRGVRLAGARAALGELVRGRATPSLIFRFHAANEPTRPAVVECRSLAPSGAPTGARDRILSCFELDHRMDEVCAALASRGFSRGSSALLMMRNRREFLEVQPAIGRVGGAAVSVSYRSTGPELAYLASHSGARALFFDAELAPVVEQALARLDDHGPSRLAREGCFSVGGGAPGFPTYESLLESATAEAVQATKAAADASEDASVVMYTSGTTGKPKGAVRKFPRDAVAYAFAFIGETPLARGDVHLVCAPLYHATAFGFTTLTCLLGGTVIVLPEFRPELFLAAVERYRVTTTALVPTMLHRILELGPEARAKHDTSSLRAIFSGGAPLSASLARDTMSAFGDVLYNFYGATETGLVTLAGPADLRASPGTIGRAVPGNEIRLLDDEGRLVADGGVGELWVRSGLLVDGYHDDPGATAGSMREGFFSVGDLARVDARGCFHIEGRKRDMIITGGVNVYPAEVEAALDEHPAVQEVAVVGIVDPEWGERVKAFVVLRQGAVTSPDELRGFLKGRLSGPKIPREIEILEELPKNPTGKVLKRELRVRG